MDNKETNNVQVRSDILLNNDEYFKYIFKKTEKIVSAVFYTTRSTEDELKKDNLIELVEDRAIVVNIVAEETLTAPRSGRTHAIENLRAALVSLESGLALLVVSRLMREDLLEVFKQEIALLQRALREYMGEYPRHPFTFTNETPLRLQKQRTTVRRESAEGQSVGGNSLRTPSRRERILGIIRDKGQVTIKDVSTAITDVSEKTIQRELMSLISDGSIVKEGERRWSKYSIATK
jgi:hypothetical protein